MPGSPLGTPDNPLRVAVIGSGPSGFYATEHLPERRGPAVQVDMYDRLPTPFGLVRGGVAPDHQKIKSVTRVYDKIAAHPEFRFYGNVEMGRDLTHDDLLAYYHAHHLRGGRAHRPAHGDPARAPARQPLGHRVRRLVQRPPGLPAHALRPLGRRARPWSATATWRWTSRASSPARARSWPPPTSPTTRSHEPSRATGARDPRPRPPRPGPGRVHQQGAEGARRAAGRQRDRRPGARSSSIRARARPYVDASDANRTRDRNLALLREYAERPPTGAPDADLAALPGLAGRDHRHGARRGPHDRPQRALRERGRHRSARARPSAAPLCRSGWSSGRSATRGVRCRASRSTPCAA